MLFPVDAVVAFHNGLCRSQIAVFQRPHGALHRIGRMTGHGKNLIVQVPQGLIVGIAISHSNVPLFYYKMYTNLTV